jgi:tetratricopeptide (TPR) repeat protein
MAKEALDKALALDPDLAEAYATLGLIRMWHDYDWKGSEEAFQRAAVLNPKSAVVTKGMALFYFYVGPLQKSIELNRQAVELDPLSTTTYYNLGRAYYSAGRLAEGENALRKALELSPRHTGARSFLGRIYLAQNRLEESLSEMKIISDDDWRSHGLAIVYHALGRQKEAEAELGKATKEYGQYFSYQIAEVYSQWNRNDTAFEWLERGYQERDTGMGMMKFDPLFKPISGDPRFQALLKKMKLE